MSEDIEIAALVADAFDLAGPTAPLRPLRHVSQETWRLDTGSGSALVKRFWTGPEVPWRTDLEAAMALEERALAAGIETPEPLRPRSPQFGAAAHIPGYGVFRAYPFLEHRPLEPADDITAWAGTTLARIQQLEPPLLQTPPPNWWFNQFPACPPEQWEQWREQGHEQRISWAPALDRNLPLLLEVGDRILETFRQAGPHVMTHRDFEPWNILIVPAGPLLIDWDVAGPDSAGLEAAHVLISFARQGQDEPDPERVRRGVQAYRDAGGHPISRPNALARTIGMRLARITQRLAVSLGADLPSVDSAKAADQARTRIEEFPAAVANADRWSELLTL
ncbi:MAG TPA: aminoglycoside phosphotransferase family protein [Mycobacteriales bacterium]|nr:aminoglycoside phosphotransferase family protein [Mycobacteriales bacterium]